MHDVQWNYDRHITSYNAYTLLIVFSFGLIRMLIFQADRCVVWSQTRPLLSGLPFYLCFVCFFPPRCFLECDYCDNNAHTDLNTINSLHIHASVSVSSFSIMTHLIKNCAIILILDNITLCNIFPFEIHETLKEASWNIKYTEYIQYRFFGRYANDGYLMRI